MDSRLRPALHYIQANLDGDLSLAALAQATGFSDSHFHALFRDHLGETPHQYVERVRLERAAFHLRIQAEPILRVALDVGYQSHETFTRAFQRRFGQSPSEFRSAEMGWPDIVVPNQPSASNYSLSKTVARIRAPLRIAFIRHIGPYESVPADLWQQVESRLQAKGWDSKGPRVGLGHDSPALTSSEKLRFDAGILVDDQVQARGELGVMELPSSPSAVTTHVGPYSSLPEAYPRIFQRAADIAGYQLVGLPALEIYQAQRMAAGNPLEFTEVYLPLIKEAENAA